MRGNMSCRHWMDGIGMGMRWQTRVLSSLLFRAERSKKPNLREYAALASWIRMDNQTNNNNNNNDEIKENNKMSVAVFPTCLPLSAQLRSSADVL